MFDSLESVTKLTGTAQAIWAGSTPTRTRLWLVRSPGLTHECHAQCHVLRMLSGGAGAARAMGAFELAKKTRDAPCMYAGGWLLLSI